MTEVQGTKKPWLSKTLWTNVIIAITAIFVPPVNEWIKLNPEAFAAVLTAINGMLRLITKDKIVLQD